MLVLGMYEKRIGKAIDARCDDCGEEEDKDHIWECMKWEKESISLGMDRRKFL